jgi:kynurenine formamidase
MEESLIIPGNGVGYGGSTGAIAALGLVAALSGPLVAPVYSQSPANVTRETVEGWMSELSNWGRWGDDDELGTLNLITPEHRIRAASLVRDGITVSLSHDYITERASDVSSPFEHEVSNSGAYVIDRFSVSYHGFGHSHMDAVCHMFYQGTMYNGFSRDLVTIEEGCTRADIGQAKGGVVSRGILMDIARLKGVDYLDLDTAIYVEDLEAWEAETGITVSSGDILLVRAGRWARRAEMGPWNIGREAPGLHASVAPWLRERGVAMLGSDYTHDLQPTVVPGVSQPIHQLTLIAMGMPLYDNLDLEALARVAADLGRWEFMLVTAPLAVPGGTGSPVNPIAIF